MRTKSVFVLIGMMVWAAPGAFAEKPKKELSGAQAWAQNCARCHSLRSASEFNDAQWEVIVRHMRVVGNIPAAQARAIVRFLQESNTEEGGAVREKREEAKKEEAQAEEVKGDPAKGKELFITACAPCHGVSGRGDGPAAAALSPKPRDLTDREYMRKLTFDYLFKVISEGGASVGKSPVMPAFGVTLEREDIINIISYVRQLSRGEPKKPKK